MAEAPHRLCFNSFIDAGLEPPRAHSSASEDEDSAASDEKSTDSVAQRTFVRAVRKRNDREPRIRASQKESVQAAAASSEPCAATLDSTARRHASGKPKLIDHDRPERMRRIVTSVREVDEGARASLMASSNAQLLEMAFPQIGADVFMRLRAGVSEAREAVTVCQQVLEQVTKERVGLEKGSALIQQCDARKAEAEQQLRSAERKFADSCECLRAVAFVLNGEDLQVRQLMCSPAAKREEILRLALLAERNAYLAIGKKEMATGVDAIHSYRNGIYSKKRKVFSELIYLSRINTAIYELFESAMEAYEGSYILYWVNAELRREFTDSCFETFEDLAKLINDLQDEAPENLQKLKFYDFFRKLITQFQSQKQPERLDEATLEFAISFFIHEANSQIEKLVKTQNELVDELIRQLRSKQETLPYIQICRKVFLISVVEFRVEYVYKLAYLTTDRLYQELMEAAAEGCSDSKVALERVLPFARCAVNVCHALFERIDQVLGALHNWQELSIQEIEGLPISDRKLEAHKAYKMKSDLLNKQIYAIKTFTKRLEVAFAVPAAVSDDELLSDFSRLAILDDAPAPAAAAPGAARQEVEMKSE